MKIKPILLTSILSSAITLLLLLSFFAIASPAASRSLDQGDYRPRVVLQEPGLFDPDGPIHKLATPEPETMAASGTSYLHIAGSDFTPLYYDTAHMYDTGGCIYSTTANPSHAHFNYSLSLPYQSTITQIRVYYKDTNGALDLTLRLREMDDGLGFSDAGIVSSVGSAGYGNATIDINYPLDYVNFSYVLQVGMNDTGSDMEFCGVRIGYIPPSLFGVALPFVNK